jgi:hypothetical protein
VCDYEQVDASKVIITVHQAIMYTILCESDNHGSPSYNVYYTCACDYEQVDASKVITRYTKLSLILYLAEVCFYKVCDP